MNDEVKLDRKGRVLIPAEIRRELKARRFRMKVSHGKIILEPVIKAESVKGKYKGLLRVSMEKLEEQQEKFLRGIGR
jgi:bifunctional DNA-binding transcriptional regulator/antitoxin component of YhaV-PrlF toxin-antitoxin module